MIYHTLEERFLAKIIRGPTEDDCWGWTATRNNKGYGSIKINGQMAPASRASWMVHFGEIPAGMHVLHTCDNPICSNPKHLWLGTHQDNMDDMYGKGRGRKDGQKALRNRKTWLRGEAVGNSKLTEEQVRWIKSMIPTRKNGFIRQTADKFGVTTGAISHIIQGRLWKHIT